MINQQSKKHFIYNFNREHSIALKRFKSDKEYDIEFL